MFLRHLNGRRSQARFQHCIFCERGVRNGTRHVLSRCERWTQERNQCLDLLSLPDHTDDAITLVLLRVRPSHPAFRSRLWFADSVADLEKEFWMKVSP